MIWGDPEMRHLNNQNYLYLLYIQSGINTFNLKINMIVVDCVAWWTFELF